MDKMDCKLILIGGGTASGKTTFALRLKDDLESSTIATQVIELDNYYFEEKEVPTSAIDGDKINWDDPSTINWERLEKTIYSLQNGEEVLEPKFSYDTNAYTGEYKLLKPTKVVIVEGIFALWDDKLVEASEESIFVDVDSEVRYRRRLARDKEERYVDHDVELYNERWIQHIQPSHVKYVQPTSFKADYVIASDELDYKFAKDAILASIK